MSKQPIVQPGLFGLKNSNRDFTKVETWGKNCFNNTFPASLACYMGSKNILPIYLCLDKSLQVVRRTITVEALFGLKELSPGLYFDFEAVYSPYDPLAIDSIPRVDLVTFDISAQPFRPLKPIEIKLTALPDNTTANLAENRYGSEIVVRPDTIVYLGLSVAGSYLTERPLLKQLLDPACAAIKDWEDPDELYPRIASIAAALDNVLLQKLNHQTPLMMQPIWKTKKTTSILADNCFDIFVWSNLGFTRLFVDAAKRERANKITRQARTVIWLAKMLYDFAAEGRFDKEQIIDRLTYNTKNDKAFAIGGVGTHTYMTCAELTTPRISKESVKEIILGEGQKYLSPERRLDAAILNSRLFD